MLQFLDNFYYLCVITGTSRSLNASYLRQAWGQFGAKNCWLDFLAMHALNHMLLFNQLVQVYFESSSFVAV